MFSVTVFTLFPSLFPGPLGLSVTGRALKLGLWSLETISLRATFPGEHRRVDDKPFGGGAGMVMRPDVLDFAFQAQYGGDKPDTFLYFSPRGRHLNQDFVKKLAGLASVGLLCGRFEGVDQRVLDVWAIEEVSIGDFLLTGGEIPAMALIDAVVRLLPGVVGSPESLKEESFANGLLEYHHYTRPREWYGISVPGVLLEGHHEKVRQWRSLQSKNLTRRRRPDLWFKYKQSIIKGWKNGPD